MSDSILTTDFEKNINLIDKGLRIDKNFDIIKRIMRFSETALIMYYIDGFVKQEMTQKLITTLSGVKYFGDGGVNAASVFAESSLPTVEVDVSCDVDTLITSVLSGCTVFMCEGFGASAIIIDTRSYPARDTEEPENDKVMRGSRDGFVETLIFNTALLRRRIRNPMLTIRYFCVGTESKTDVAMCYIEGKADNDYINTLAEKLNGLKVHSLTLGHQSLIESLVPTGLYNPFPKIRQTERPDAASAVVLEGGIILFCDNSPEAMIFPTSIFDFLQETDDYYFPPLVGTYLRVLRHTIFWLTVVLTPLWYLLIKHSGILPEWLEFIVPRDPGELPVLLQLFLTEFAIDGLKLASLNTPGVLSNSLSVVGGLLLGDFAVTVGWLSPDVILYMAFVAISNFTQSSYELGYAFKFIRMITLILTALFDIWGFVAGFVFAIILLITNSTANGKRSYLYPLIPFDGKALCRLLFRLKKRY